MNWKTTSLLSICLFCFANPSTAQSPFEDVTDAVGLASLGGGVACWIDYNNDDWPDLYTSGKLFKNNEGQFELIENSGLSGSGTWADLNNDGFLDFFSFTVPCGVYLSQLGTGNETFQKVDGGVPTELPMEVSLGAAAGDFDKDGMIDIYLGGYEIWQKANYHDIILRNSGDGTFKEVWRTEGGPQPARGIAACDIDEDGDIDVYVSNYRLAKNMLWRNDGSGNFANAVDDFNLSHEPNIGKWYGHTIGSAIGDMDSDGHFDIFIGNFSHPQVWQDRPKFMKNLGPEQNYQFEDRSKDAALIWQESFASPAFADFDNDGLVDLFFTTVYSGDHSVLLKNQGDWKFADVTESNGISTAQTYQSAWGDFDRDGNLDLVSGGRIFKNPGSENKWLKIKLVDSDHLPLPGAQARIKVGDKTITRQVSCSTGQGNQNETTLHFGLGATDKEVVVAEVQWPNGDKLSTPVKVGELNLITRNR